VKKALIATLATVLAVTPSLAKQGSVIDERQAIFEALETELDRLDDAEDWRATPERWTDLAQSVRDMKQLYPEGSRDDSRSRGSVWSKQDDFMNRLDDLALDLERMGEAGALGNESNFEHYRDEVDSSCLGCHMRFKSLF